MTTAHSDDVAVSARGVTFRYGERVACKDLEFEVARGGVHAFLGPNGSGKSTLFKVLSTVYPMQDGDVRILGSDLRSGVAAIRERIGVVFQSPALDGKLSVRENLVYGGHLYGLSGAELNRRIDEMLANTGLTDRSKDNVAALSGGLRRRVELAKGLLSKPDLVLLDEPSTGLDPGARHDLWRFLGSLEGLTVLFTTHLMDEAERADDVTILSEGSIVAAGKPADLVRSIGSQVLEVACADPEVLAPKLAARLGVEPIVLERSLRVQRDDAHKLVPDVIDGFGDEVETVAVSHPSLEDVFIQATGHRFWGDEEGAS